MEDPDNYLPLARSLAEGRGFSLDGRLTAYRPPLYPLMLSPLTAVLGERTVWGVAALHLALAAGTILLTAEAARRWGLTAERVLAAATLVALDPVLVSQCRLVMTETLAALLTAAALAALARGGTRGAATGGCLFGLATLCRPSALAAATLTALVACFAGPADWTVRLRRGAVIAAATMATLLPWAARNVLVFGEPVFTTTHGGYTLYLANNPVYYDEVVNGPSGAVWTGPNQKLWWEQVNRSARGLTEPEADRAMRAAALNVIATRPADFIRASLARLGRFWGLTPAGAVYPRWLRLATSCWTAPFWALMAIGLLSRDAWIWPRVSAPAMLLALTIVHFLYWTDMRMRAPVVPAVALVAAAARARRVQIPQLED
jgi:hypothetical protein